MMTGLTILGTSNAIPQVDRENTYFLLENKESVILIDAGANAVARLCQMKISVEKVTDIIITHFHPDHVSGLPLLLMDWWLMGRKSRLTIHGLPHAIERIQQMLDLFEWHNWPDFFEVEFHAVPDDPGVVLENDSLKIISRKVKHLIPTFGLRMEWRQGGEVVAYSCDTEPCDAVVALAENADYLIHEAAGDAKGHSSARQCGAVAARAGAKRLVLIHYPEVENPQQFIDEAQLEFGGEVILAKDCMTLE